MRYSDSKVLGFGSPIASEYEGVLRKIVVVDAQPVLLDASLCLTPMIYPTLPSEMSTRHIVTVHCSQSSYPDLNANIVILPHLTILRLHDIA